MQKLEYVLENKIHINEENSCYVKDFTFLEDHRLNRKENKKIDIS